MLALSGERSQGAVPYNVTPRHTKQAAAILGPGKILAVEQKVTIETDAARARTLGRKELARYMVLPNYRNNWLREGFTEAVARVTASVDAERMAAIAKALGDPVRLQLVDVLRKHAGKVCVCELVPLLDLSQPTVSHHLKTLVEAGLIECRREGQFVYNRVLPETMREYTQALSRMARVPGKQERKV